MVSLFSAALQAFLHLQSTPAKLESEGKQKMLYSLVDISSTKKNAQVFLWLGSYGGGSALPGSRWCGKQTIILVSGKCAGSETIIARSPNYCNHFNSLLGPKLTLLYSNHPFILQLYLPLPQNAEWTAG